MTTTSATPDPKKLRGANFLVVASLLGMGIGLIQLDLETIFFFGLLTSYGVLMRAVQTGTIHDRPKKLVIYVALVGSFLLWLVSKYLNVQSSDIRSASGPMMQWGVPAVIAAVVMAAQWVRSKRNRK